MKEGLGLQFIESLNIFIRENTGEDADMLTIPEDLEGDFEAVIQTRLSRNLPIEYFLPILLEATTNAADILEEKSRAHPRQYFITEALNLRFLADIPRYLETHPDIKNEFLKTRIRYGEN